MLKLFHDINGFEIYVLGVCGRGVGVVYSTWVSMLYIILSFKTKV